MTDMKNNIKIFTHQNRLELGYRPYDNGALHSPALLALIGMDFLFQILGYYESIYNN